MNFIHNFPLPEEWRICAVLWNPDAKLSFTLLRPIQDQAQWLVALLRGSR